jgi:hypothetical protein
MTKGLRIKSPPTQTLGGRYGRSGCNCEYWKENTKGWKNVPVQKKVILNQPGFYPEFNWLPFL